jgi:hypothetical protein
MLYADARAACDKTLTLKRVANEKKNTTAEVPWFVGILPCVLIILVLYSHQLLIVLFIPLLS